MVVVYVMIALMLFSALGVMSIYMKWSNQVASTWTGEILWTGDTLGTGATWSGAAKPATPSGIVIPSASGKVDTWTKDAIEGKNIKLNIPNTQ